MSTATPESVDLRGLKCPLPALISRRRLSRSPPGTVILVVTDDPMAPIDVPHMCADAGFEVVRVERDGDIGRMTLRSGLAVDRRQPRG